MILERDVKQYSSDPIGHFRVHPCPCLFCVLVVLTSICLGIVISGYPRQCKQNKFLMQNGGIPYASSRFKEIFASEGRILLFSLEISFLKNV